MTETKQETHGADVVLAELIREGKEATELLLKTQEGADRAWSQAVAAELQAAAAPTLRRGIKAQFESARSTAVGKLANHWVTYRMNPIPFEQVYHHLHSLQVELAKLDHLGPTLLASAEKVYLDEGYVRAKRKRTLTHIQTFLWRLTASVKNLRAIMPRDNASVRERILALIAELDGNATPIREFLWATGLYPE